MLLLRLGLAAGVVLALEISPLWRLLRGGLSSLDFDPARAALLSAWVACFAVALVAGALSRRPWPSVLAATAFLAATYALPWAWQATQERPVLFGFEQRLDGVALLRNLAVTLAVGFVAAVPAAATGQFLASSAAAWLRALRLRADRREGLLGAVLAVPLVGSVALAASGAGSLVRYGPGEHVYTPASGTATAPPGQVLVRSARSSALGEERPFAVYLPAGYDRSQERRYPTVFLLHGAPGSYRDWLNLNVARIADTGVAAGSLPEAILVMPEGSGKAGRPSQWADSRDGRDRVETAVLELVSLIDNDYRTLPDRGHRVIAGLSDGGFGAANLAARHPDVFGFAISLSGYFKAEGPAFGQDPDYIRANSPMTLVDQGTAARSVDYVLVAGQQDGRYLGKAQAFAAVLDRRGVRHALFELPGAHDGGVWTQGLAQGLQHIKAGLEEGTR